jgi:lysophospholipase L1-like esterase
VNFTVSADANVTVSFYVPTTTGYTQHETAQQTNYYADGDQSGNADLSGALTYSSYSLLSDLDVQNTAATGSVVAFGASITDAVASSFGANRRWPNLLAKRLNGSGRTVGVLNEGISGNNLLFDGSGQKALTRFGHDVVQQPGVKWVIVSDDPINDLLRSDPPSAQDLINGLSQLISQAHSAQIKVLCSTLTPFKGTTVGAGWSTQAESGRDTINAFLRGSSSGCDGIVDQDTATHDPSNPQAFRPDLDSGDHLHPNDAGMQAIADAVPLTLLGTAGTPQPATISLKASNGLFVTAENGGADPLIANRTAVGTWEKFDVTYLSGDQVQLRSEANGLFVTAENAGADPLIANRTTAALWETFHLIRNSDGTCSLVSEANNRYVTSNNGTAPLIANQTANNGWEHFTVAAA